MKRLDLQRNTFGDGGGAALLECLHNINKLCVAGCLISPEMKTKMETRAREKNVLVEFQFCLN